MTRKIQFTDILWVFFWLGAGIGLFFQFNYHKFLNFDTLAYINIAELYAKGNWQYAVNGCWSPLYSWLLALCKLSGIPLLAACYIINFLAAAICFSLTMQIGRRYLHTSLFFHVFSIYILLLLLYYAMSTLTPDLIATAFGMWFLRLISDKHFFHSRKVAIYAGIAAAGMYFAKSYNFLALHMFFIVLFIIELRKKDDSQEKGIKQIARSYLFFMLISIIWISVLSIHEKRLVFSTAGSFTHNLVSPDYKKYYPIYNKIYPPPFEGAYSILIDPTHTLDEYKWSPFDNSLHFKHQVKLFINSLKGFYRSLDSSGIKGLLLAAALIFIVINRKKIKMETDSSLKILFWFMVLYPLFYLPIFIVDRYILICIILFHLFLFYCLQLSSRLLTKKLLFPIAIGALGISLLPLIINGEKKLFQNSGEYTYYKDFHDQLSRFSFLENKRIVADGASSLESIQLCYYFKCRYYCTWREESVADLKSMGIEFLISKSERKESFLELTEKVPVKTNTLYIYRIR